MRPSSKSTFTPDPVESFLNEIPIIQLEASNDHAACNMDYYPMDAALGTHEVFSNWNYDQFHNASVEFTDTTTHPHPLPFEVQCETELIDVQGFLTESRNHHQLRDSDSRMAGEEHSNE
jgi:hypothetical protein